MIIPYMNQGIRYYGENPVAAMCRGCWEVQIILEGDAVIQREEGTDPVPGNPALYVNPPDSVHGWTSKPGGKAVVKVVHLPQLGHGLLQGAGAAARIALTLSPEETKLVEFVWEYLYPHFVHPKPSSYLGVNAADAMLTELLARRVSRPGEAVDFAREKSLQALHYVRQHVRDQPTVAEVATIIGVSPSHFRRLFNSAMGCSPAKGFMEERMRMAKALLASGTPVGDVAEALGYSETSAFSRAFHGHCGHYPTQLSSAAK